MELNDLSTRAAVCAEAGGDGSSHALTRQAHVWLARPQPAMDSDSRNQLLSLLDQAEKNRYHRFVFDKDRDHYLAAHALVRTALSRYADVTPGDWKFVANRYGRPEIAGEFGVPFLRFNLSHTNGLVVCIVSDEIDCGVDAETIRPFANYLSIAKWMFTEEEYAHLVAAPPARRHETFFNYWTLKEAYIKARGFGLSLSTTSFRFSIEESRRISIHFNAAADDCSDAWQFQLLRPTDEHVVALALKSGSRNDAIQQRWLADAM